MADWIFLDHHTKSPPSRKITEQMGKDLQNQWIFGEEKKEKIGQEIASLFGMDKGQLHLASSGAESHFQILLSHYIDTIRETGRTHILTPETEMESITKGIHRLEKFEVQGKKLPVNANGQLTRRVLEETVRPRSSLLTLSWAHPLTGVVQPIHDLLEVCREHDIRVHLDISAAVGKLYLPLGGLEIDYLTFDGGLLHCPMPIGATLVKEGGKLAPLSYSGVSQPYATFSAIASAATSAQEKIDTYAMEVARLRDLFEQKLADMGGTLYFQEVERLPNTIVVSFPNIHGEHLLFHLKRRGLLATNGKGKLAKILQQSGVDPIQAHAAISLTLSDLTTDEEIDKAAELIQELTLKLQPLYAHADSK